MPAVCPASEFTSSLINIPAPDTGDNDHNPQRIAPRSLFDASLGKDNIFHAERYKVDLDLTAINVTNKYALYNFLSTFSGTHYVTPRALTAKITLELLGGGEEWASLSGSPLFVPENIGRRYLSTECLA